MAKDLKKIVWLASYPKSGNTWFRVFLSNLLSEKEVPVSINELHSTPIASSRVLFDNYAGTSSSDLSNEEIEELRPEIYRREAMEAGETIFHKVHDAWGLTPSGKPAFPPDVTKGVIYFIRNPLDVTVSFAFHNKKQPTEMVEKVNDPEHAFCGRPEKLHNQLMQRLLDWSGHVKSWVDDSGLPVLVIRYEDMLTDTYNTFKKGMRFAGIDKTDSEIETAIMKSSLERLKEMEQEEGFKEKPIGMESFFRSGRQESWKEFMDREDAGQLVKKHRVFMERFGYTFEN